MTDISIVGNEAVKHHVFSIDRSSIDVVAGIGEQIKVFQTCIIGYGQFLC